MMVSLSVEFYGTPDLVRFLGEQRRAGVDAHHDRELLND